MSDQHDAKAIKRISAPAISIISFIGAAISIGMGFYKMIVYENPSYGEVVNAYVGGDAYNYIINANYATAYFAFAAVLVIFGGFFLIKNTMEELNLNWLQHCTLSLQGEDNNSVLKEEGDKEIEE